MRERGGKDDTTVSNLSKQEENVVRSGSGQTVGGTGQGWGEIRHLILDLSDIQGKMSRTQLEIRVWCLRERLSGRCKFRSCQR